ncbi:hypothetical protein Bbelb_186800 [Branchiostoma belcheri]|nr:hypothetical protein Bbelb_186800 [Branchiostoma belcheri]
MIYFKDGVKPDPKKVEAINKMKEPKDAKELRSFLGLIQYMTAFIQNLTNRTANMRELLKEDTEYKWSESHLKDFNRVKRPLTKDTTLQYYDRSKPVTLQATGEFFLEIANIKQEPNERPEDLYQRLTAAVEDNLLTTVGDITHHGEAVTTNEEVTPSLENMVVLLWLHMLHPDLPSLGHGKVETDKDNLETKHIDNWLEDSSYSYCLPDDVQIVSSYLYPEIPTTPNRFSVLSNKEEEVFPIPTKPSQYKQRKVKRTEASKCGKSRTLQARGVDYVVAPYEAQLAFFSMNEPHQVVSTSTISRWIKGVLQEAGLDTSNFTRHSTRGASVSAAARRGVSTRDIIKAVNWSTASTFEKFYKKPVRSASFGKKILAQQLQTHLEGVCLTTEGMR